MNVYFPPADFWWTNWTFDPGIWFGIVALHGAYLLLVGPLRARFGPSSPVTSRQLGFWTLGIIVLIVALITPISALSDLYLFSAHMLQHILLTLVAAPLLLLGLPGWFFAPLARYPRLLAFARHLTGPFAAFGIFNVIFVAWHVPYLYNMALYSTGVHILEHFTMVAAALLTWMPILSPTRLLPRLPLPVQVFYLFLQSIVGTGLGAILTLAPTPIYLFYIEAPRIWAITVMDDQVWAGLLMWIAAGLIFLFALTLVFFRWFSAQGPIEGEHKFV